MDQTVNLISYNSFPYFGLSSVQSSPKLICEAVRLAISHLWPNDRGSDQSASCEDLLLAMGMVGSDNGSSERS